MDICLHELREAGDHPGRLALESPLFMAPEGLVDGRDRGCRGNSWRSPWVGTVPVTKKGVLGCHHPADGELSSSAEPPACRHPQRGALGLGTAYAPPPPAPGACHCPSLVVDSHLLAGPAGPLPGAPHLPLSPSFGPAPGALPSQQTHHILRATFFDPELAQGLGTLLVLVVLTAPSSLSPRPGCTLQGQDRAPPSP